MTSQDIKNILKETQKYKFNSVLDIGLGVGFASKFFKDNGKKVFATGYDIESYGLQKDFFEKIELFRDIDVEDMNCFKSESFDAVWASHILEHSKNVGKSLSEMRRVLKKEGHLFLVIPPYLPYVVGGHVSIGWNLGNLMYNLLLSGFDIKNGSFIRVGYNLVAFVKKGSIPKEKLRFDNGDINTLSKYFPFKIKEGFCGNIKQVNWSWKYSDKKFGAKLKEVIIENIVSLKRSFLSAIIKLRQDMYYLFK